MDEIVFRMRDARVIESVEGNALMYGRLSMSLNCALVCIQPPFRFTGLLKDHVDATGVR